MSRLTKVLIVDDEELIRMNLRALLEDLGYGVIEAANGQEGLEAFDRDHPDLVLADIRMPVMDGLALITALKEKSPETPAIVVSGTGTVRSAVDSLRLGAWDFVMKPVADMETFEFAITRALEKARLIKENRRYREHLEELVRERTEELHVSETRYRRLIKSVTSYVYTVTVKDGRPDATVHSPGCEAVTGYTPEEYAADPDLWYRMILDPDRLLVTEAAQRILDESLPVSLEHRFSHRDGTVVWVQNTLVPHRSSAGELLSYDGIVVDITERKRLEGVLRESEERFRTLTEESPVGVYIIQDDLFRYVNPAFEKLCGYTSGEIVDKLGPMDFILPEGGELGVDFLGLGISGEIKVGHIELCVSHKDGSIRIAEIFGAHALHRGHPAVLGTVIDITERKKSEEKLFQATDRWARTFDAVPDLIAIIDTNHRIVQVNKAMANRLACAPEECVGQNCYRIVHGRETPPSFCPQTLTLRDNREHVVEVNEARLGGDFIVSTSPIHDSAGQLIGSVHVARDITERKRAEQEQAELQAQFLQAQKMESVARLAGGVAHDFNNMLGVISGYTEIALELVDPTESISTNLQLILKAARRSADLTRQLLAFARKQTISPKVLDLNESVESMLILLRRLIGENIVLAWLPGQDLWPVNMDPSQIDQILANLCVNARDAITGTGKITIETAKVTLDHDYCANHPGVESGEYVLLAVSDDGQGMDKTTLDKIFEPFFTTKEMGKGTGLGLATVYGIIKQNSGLIDVHSKVGYGTAINIYLPRYMGPAVVTKRERTVKRPSSRGETVLIVEDEPEFMDMTKMMLENLGYRVLTAGTPGQAIALAGEHASEIQVLITDVIMPEMNGRDLAELLESICPSVKVLFMSGYTANVIVHQGVLDEGLNFLQKPFSVKDLAVKLQNMLHEM